MLTLTINIIAHVRFRMNNRNTKRTIEQVKQFRLLIEQAKLKYEEHN